ncbi:MAG: hypothetical protein J6I57_07000, partial [Desulfovibrio sp.]|nr:hypothetical protein [Desulfovibrio sp.]
MLQTPVVKDELTVFPQAQVPLILSGAASPVFHGPPKRTPVSPCLQIYEPGIPGLPRFGVVRKAVDTLIWIFPFRQGEEVSLCFYTGRSSPRAAPFLSAGLTNGDTLKIVRNIYISTKIMPAFFCIQTPALFQGIVLRMVKDDIAHPH